MKLKLKKSYDLGIGTDAIDLAQFEVLDAKLLLGRPEGDASRSRHPIWAAIAIVFAVAAAILQMQFRFEILLHFFLTPPINNSSISFLVSSSSIKRRKKNPKERKKERIKKSNTLLFFFTASNDGSQRRHRNHQIPSLAV